MKKEDERIKEYWLKRSIQYKDNPKGVVTKSIPDSINKYFEDWSIEQIALSIDKEKNNKILDVGCGYGRLAKQILKKYKNVNIYGVDISPVYVKLFNFGLKPYCKAKVADVRKLPYVKGSFDLVFVVTTLVYLLREKDRIAAFKEMFRVLKKNGKLVIIERNPSGYNLVTLGGLIEKLRNKGKRDITGVSFDKNTIESLLEKTEGRLIGYNGIPFFTLFLPFMFVANKISDKFLNLILKTAKKLDLLFGHFTYPSLYISYTIKKGI